jgi:hypothetical protein
VSKILQALVKNPDGSSQWQEVEAVREVEKNLASYRLALLEYACGPSPETGHTHYVISVSATKSEATIERRSNFVRWLGPRLEVKQ